MSHVFVPFFAFAIAFAITPAMRAAGRRLKLIDVPNERSSHAAPTPRTGGYAIVAGMILAGIASIAGDRSALPLLLGAVGIAIAAAADEFVKLHNGIRFALQIVVATVALAYAGALAMIDVPLAGRFALGAFGIAVSVFWVVGVLNGFNFMDGVNGIASTEAIICGGALAMLFARHSDPTGQIVALALVGAAAGFLPWNLPSGSIFMGDVGSATLGFMLAMLVVRAANDGVSFFAAALPLCPFLFDSGVTLVRRIAGGHAFFFEPHRTHFYQRLNRLGFSHTAVTTVWSALAVLSSAAALLYDRLGDRGRLLLLAIVLAVHVLVAITITLREGPPSTALREED